MGFEVCRVIGVEPPALDQAAGSVTAGTEALVERGSRRKARCRSKGWFERMRPGGCCGWYSG